MLSKTLKALTASENKLEKPLFLRGNDKIFGLKKIGQLHKIMTSINFSHAVGYFLMHFCTFV
jgi:hypothetical protein|tara:strand:- start:17587 stop:17772 length:186 start_codon:yes stop_codon:yes gene_type:complete